MMKPFLKEMRKYIFGLLMSFNYYQVFLGVAFAVALIFLYQAKELQEIRVYQEQRKAHTEEEKIKKFLEPATNWFEVKDLFVPNFVLGEDPILLYDRDIKRSFQGEWLVEIEKVTGRGVQFICKVEGRNNYRPENILMDQTTLNWFMAYDGRGTVCGDKILETGSYRIEVRWRIEPDEPGYDVKIYRYTTRPFMITVTNN